MNSTYLTDDELKMALTVSDRLQTLNHRAYVDREALALADRLQRAAMEVERHRAAVAAGRERVRAVVRDISYIEICKLLGCGGGMDADTSGARAVTAIATRAADQIPTAAGLSEQQRNHLISVKRRLADEFPLWRDEIETLVALIGGTR